MNATNMESGLVQAKNGVIQLLQFLIDVIGVPIMCIIAAGIMIFYIVGAVHKHRNGEDFSDSIVKIVICLVVIAVVGSFPLWGWVMLGVTTVA